MEVNEVIKIINEIGFPIFVSVMFIFRIDKKLQIIISNLKVINEKINK